MSYSMFHSDDRPTRADLVIVGSGLIGATFARIVSERRPGTRIIMVEVGPQLTRRYGAHVRSIPSAAGQAAAKQHSQGPMASWPPERMASPDAVDAEDRSLARPGTHLVEGASAGGMPAAAMSSCVGGMGAHWTCAVPRPRGSEVIDFIDAAELDAAFTEAERIVAASVSASIRSEATEAVEAALAGVFRLLLPGEAPVRAMPLSARREADGGLVWLGTDVVFGPLAEPDVRDDHFTLLADTLCLGVNHQAGRATGVSVQHRVTGQVARIDADAVVVAADSLRTPQLLFASHIRPDALGRYLNEHICLVATVRPDRSVAIEAPRSTSVNAGLDEMLASLWIPFEAERHPFHGQVTCIGPSSSGLLGSAVTSARLAWYSAKEIRAEDRIRFSETAVDGSGLPAMAIDYALTPRDQAAIAGAEHWLRRAAGAIGPFQDGLAPRLLPKGSSLHYQGTTRMGTDAAMSVCDSHSRVWGFDNLYVGGNGVIPTPTASNPTLTSMALAVRAAERLAGRLG